MRYKTNGFLRFGVAGTTVGAAPVDEGVAWTGSERPRGVR